MKRVVFLALMVVVFMDAVSVARTPTPLAALQSGQRVKLQGRLNRDRILIARTLEVVPDRIDFEIEGLISRLNRETDSFQIGLWTVTANERTKFEESGRQPISSATLANGMRVRVRARKIENRRVYARRVRAYQGSRETDIDLIARIDNVNASRSEIGLLGCRVAIEERTRFINTQAPGSVDFEPTRTVRTLRRDDDEQHLAPIRIGKASIGGHVRLEHDRTRNRDLDDRTGDGEDWIRPRVEVEISVPVGESSELYTRLNVTRPTIIGAPSDPENRADFDVREVFLYWGNFLHSTLALQVGRQRFRDRREWLYDEPLDAVRLHFFPRSGLKFEFSAAKGLVGPTTSRRNQYHFIASTSYRLPGRRYVGAYILKRNDLTRRDEDPIWYGLSSRGAVWRDLSYWAEFARMKGRRGSNLLRGHAWDAGGTWRFRLPLQPAVSAGYAFGSGDRNPDDGSDGNFRQTSLNDNVGRFNGLKLFRYYGILTAPDLTNLRIGTLNVGVRRASDWSLDLAFHTYRQAVAARRFLGDIELLMRPSGRDVRLGKEIDAVLAIRKIPRTDLNFYTGVFLPGPAFRGRPARALVFRQEFKVYF